MPSPVKLCRFCVNAEHPVYSPYCSDCGPKFMAGFWCGTRLTFMLVVFLALCGGWSLYLLANWPK